MNKEEKIISGFVDSMKVEINSNREKGDWMAFKNQEDILSEINYHYWKVRKSFENRNLTELKEHIADTANLLMFLGNANDFYTSIKPLNLGNIKKLKSFFYKATKISIADITDETKLIYPENTNNFGRLINDVEYYFCIKIPYSEQNKIETFSDLQYLIETNR